MKTGDESRKMDATALRLEPGGNQRVISALVESQDVSREEEDMADGLRELDEAAPYIGDDSLGDDLDYMDACADGRIRPIPLPWPNVAKGLGGGLWPGLHVLTGSTGTGKTQWALQVALCAAKAGVPTLYGSLELGRREMRARALSLMLAERESWRRGPKWNDLYRGRDKGALKRARGLMPDMKGLQLRLEATPSRRWHADLLRERVAKFRDEHPETEGPGSRPLLVVVDYLQALASTPHERLELRERIKDAAYAACYAAEAYEVVILALSSVARAQAELLNDWRKNDKLGDADKLLPSELEGMGKESGDIEFAASSVLALCRGKWNGTSTDMHLALAKVREGPPSWQELSFNGGWFSDSSGSDGGEAAESAESEFVILKPGGPKRPRKGGA